jgi:hypothetical protein
MRRGSTLPAFQLSDALFANCGNPGKITDKVGVSRRIRSRSFPDSLHSFVDSARPGKSAVNVSRLAAKANFRRFPPMSRHNNYLPIPYKHCVNSPLVIVCKTTPLNASPASREASI